MEKTLPFLHYEYITTCCAMVPHTYIWFTSFFSDSAPQTSWIRHGTSEHLWGHLWIFQYLFFLQNMETLGHFQPFMWCQKQGFYHKTYGHFRCFSGNQNRLFSQDVWPSASLIVVTKKRYLQAKPWCFLNPNQVIIMPEPKQSISKRQERSREFHLNKHTIST